MNDDQGNYQPLTYFQLMEVSLRELLVEKGILTDEQVDARGRGHAQRARPSAARRWWRAPGSMPASRSACWRTAPRPARSSASTCRRSSWSWSRTRREVHNAIVCTLCSCYPRMLLGIPPEWYKSRNYRSRMVREPRAVLAEFGLQIPEKTPDPRARLHRRHALHRAADAPGRHRRLERGAPGRARHRDCMIGVAVPKGPHDEPAGTPPQAPRRGPARRLGRVRRVLRARSTSR